MQASHLWMMISTTRVLALLAVKALTGLRVPPHVEADGIDRHVHGEEAYALDLQFPGAPA